ncbi:hypothetical protein [Spiroplasma endosymbiont of Seladonia tumulorum]|uniref:hypothetical protein n=1 Tax=Spiroplasma endosymbiont of Seladonia tumulorum TaxID=3066321 RepID=UPI0030D5177D
MRKKAFVDEKIGVLKYQTLTLNLELKILELSEGKRQKDILHCFPNINLTRMTISNVIRKYDIEYFSSHLFNEFEKIKLEENSCLYIFMDEGFVSLKEEKQIKYFRCRITTYLILVLILKNVNITEKY